MKRIFIFLLLSISISLGDEWHDRWVQAGNSWQERWSKTLDGLANFPEKDRISTLARGVALGKTEGEMPEERKEIFERAKAELISIPGHATYFKDKIETMRSELLDRASSVESPETIEKYDRYEKVRAEAFLVLSLLPTSESVSVLGYFLHDPQGRDRKGVFGEVRGSPDHIVFPSNSEAAAIALRKIGITNPPFPKPERMWENWTEEGEFEAWKTWWEEVSTGKRTYRFKGSAIEYGPDGPATAEQIKRAAEFRKRDMERAAGQRKAVTLPSVSDSSNSKPLSSLALWTAIACLAVLVTAMWYFSRRKSRWSRP